MARLDRGYMVDDDVTDESGIGWDDCEFQQKNANLYFALFGLKDACGIKIAFSKKDLLTQNRVDLSITLAPLFYEKLYRKMFEHKEFSHLWCKGDENACAFANTLALFSHTTNLQLKEVKAGDLPAVELQKVFDSVGKPSPVFLKVADSIVIMNSTADHTWTGFDIKAPEVIKTWSNDEIKKFSIAYAESHESLPRGMVLETCHFSIE